MHRYLLIPLVLIVTATAPAAQATFPTDAKALQARMRVLIPDLEQALGSTLKAPTITIASSADLAKIISTENNVAMAKIVDGPRGAALARANKAEARTIAKLVFAKVAFDTANVHWRPATFRKMAQIGDGMFKKLETERFVDVVLAHELVHVWQHARQPLRDFVGTPASIEELRTRFAVLEGHAQYITRKICKKRGLLPELELWTKLLKHGGKGTDDKAMKIILDVMSANLAFAYVEGERFFTAVAKKLGYEEAVTRVFGAPPTTYREVSKPGVYLADDADQGPDLTEIGAKVLDLLPDDTYRKRAVSVPMAALRPALKLGDPDMVEKAIGGVISARTIVGHPKKGMRGEMLSVSIFHTDGNACATTWLELQEAVSRKKDEVFKEGPTRITQVDYEDDAAGKGSIYIKKLVKSPGLTDPYPVQTVILSRGPWHVEVMSVLTKETRESLVKLAKRVVALTAGKTK